MYLILRQINDALVRSFVKKNLSVNSTQSDYNLFKVA